MAAHRYWRARGLRAYDGGSSVDLSEFWLMAAGSRVDTPAVLTSSVAPLSGTLANLRDNDTGTGCELSTTSVLTWDFDPTPADVDDIRLGAMDTVGRFLQFCLIEYSDDATTWVGYDWGDILQRPQSYGWPGARTLTTTVDPRSWDTQSFLRLEKDAGDDRVVTSTASLLHYGRGEAYASAGVRQFEFVRTSVSTPKYFGVWRFDDTTVDNTSSEGWMIDPSAGIKQEADGANTSYPAGGWLATDVFGCVIDFAAGTMTGYKNGVSLGVAFSNLAGFGLRPGITATNSIETITLRTNGFVYPIAGASPWTRAVIRPGVPMSTPAVHATSNGGHSLPFGEATDVSPHRALPNYLFDPAARGFIAGTVKRDADPVDLPLRRKVRLYRDRDGMLIREDWSTLAGGYEFEYLEEMETYTVIAYDHLHDYRAVVADNIMPELMT